MSRKAVWLLCVQVLVALNSLGAGDEVLVVYNSRFHGSREVAEYYARKRGVPPSQVVALKLPGTPEMSRDEFRTKLQLPLARLLEERKLWEVSRERAQGGDSRAKATSFQVTSSKIRYILLCHGVPYRIAEDAHLDEPGASKLRAELRRNEAAVDSELAWLPLLGTQPLLAGWLPNPTFAATNRMKIGPGSGVVVVTRLDGPSPEIARGLVDKALLAESNGFWGRAYFDLRGTTDPALKPGDDWLGQSAEICRRLGYETVIDKEPQTFPASFPMPQIGIYAGWYAEKVCGPFTQEHVEFMPGAFAYHLHSYNAGRLRDPDQGWVGPLLAKGATLTMGTVSEPYLAATPDLPIFLDRFLRAGFTFGEAAYASINTLSWQATVIGDPLYRPAAEPPNQMHAKLRESNSPFLEWSWLRLIDVNLAANRPIDDLVTALETLDLCKTSAILTEKLGDLYAAQGKPASAASAWERALKLNPTEQEKAQLRLKLTERQRPIGRGNEQMHRHEVQ